MSTNEHGINADASTQSNLWSKDDERQDDGFRRDEFGNRLDDDGRRVDPEGRPMDIEGNPVDEEGDRIDDEGRVVDDHNPGLLGGVIPIVPPMMGH